MAAALLALASRDFDVASRALYTALLEAKLLVAATDLSAEDAEGMELRLTAVPDETGVPRLMAFASERSFALGGQPGGFAVAPATGLFGFALRNGVEQVSIDSGGPVAVTLDRWELEALADGRLPDVPRRELSLSPVDPASVPGMGAALDEIFAPGTVFLLEEKESGDALRLLLGMVAPPPVAVGELADRLRNCLPGGEGLSLLRLTRSETDELRRAGVRALP